MFGGGRNEEKTASSGGGKVGAAPGRGRARKGGKGSGPSTEGGTSTRPARPPQPTGRPGRTARVEQGRDVLGVVATRSGWVGAHLDASGHGTPAIVARAGLQDLVALAGDVTVVAVDVPVGLPDDGPRDADKQTRSFVGSKGAAEVFTTPVRAAVYAATYGEANTLNREKVGSGVARQAYDRRAHIMEVDEHVRADLPYRLVETHPGAAFTELAGGTLESKRRSAEGSAQRRALLAAAGIHAPTTAPIGVSTEDMLDACAAAWTAHRVKNGQARSFPEEPQTFTDGIPSAIHV